MSRRRWIAALSLLLAPLLASWGISAATTAGGSDPVPHRAGQRAGTGSYFDAHYELIFFAVLEGLYRDGVSDEVVASLTSKAEGEEYPSLFVWSCPICMPAYNAFLVYRGRPAIAGIKKAEGDGRSFGKGLSPDVRARCLSPSRDVRFQALYDLVEGWVEERLVSMRLSDEERARWSQGMEERRKKGMATLQGMRNAGQYDGMKSCALCDGANDAFLR